MSTSHLIKPEGSSPHSQQSAVENYTDPPYQCSPPFSIYLKIHFNITSPLTSMCSKRSNRFWFSGYDAVCIFRVPIRATCHSHHPNNLWRTAQLGDPRVTMKQPRGKCKICSYIQSQDQQDVLCTGGGRTVPRITVDWAELCAASRTGRCIPGQKVWWA